MWKMGVSPVQMQEVPVPKKVLTPVSKKRQRSSNDDVLDKAILDLCNKPHELDELDSLFTSYCLCVRKLPENMQSLVQLQLSQILYNAENPMLQAPLIPTPCFRVVF